MLTLVCNVESIQALGQKSNYTSLNLFLSPLVATLSHSAKWDRRGLSSLFKDWPPSTQSDGKKTFCFFFGGSFSPLSLFPDITVAATELNCCDPQMWPLLVLVCVYL